MADAIKSVVVEIETKLQGNGVKTLNNELQTADKLANELVRQIQAVDKALESSKRKSFKIDGVDTSRKDLVALQSALLQAAKEYDKLTDIQKNTLAALLKENERVIDSLQKAADSGASAGSGIETYLKAINTILPLLGQQGVAVSLVTTNVLEFIRSLKSGEESSGKFGDILNTLKNGWTGLAVAITATVGIGLNEYFTNTSEGADLLQSKLQGLKSAFSNFAGGIVALGGAIVNLQRGDFEKLIEDARLAFNLFRDVPGAFDRGTKLSDNIKILEDRAFNAGLTISKLKLQIRDLETSLTEEVVTIGDARKRKETIEQLRVLGQQLASNNVIQKDAARSIAILRAAEVSQIDGVTEATIEQGLATDDLSFVMSEYRNEIKAADDALKEARKEEERYTGQLNKKEKSINNQIKTLQKTAVDAVLEIQNKINETSESFIGVLLSGDIKPEQKAKAQNELLKTYSGLKKDFENAVKKVEEITPGIFNGTKEQLVKAAEDIGVDPLFIQRIKDAFADAGQLFDEAFIETFLLSGEDQFKKLDEEQKKAVRERFKSLLKQVGEIVRSESQFDDAFFQGEQEKKKFNIYELIFGEDKEVGKEALEAFDRNIKSAFNTFIDSEIAKTDFLIQEQQRRIDETTRLAAFGNAEQLQLEQARLNKLLEERRKYEQAQQAINAAAAISATAASAAYFAGSLTKTSFESTPVLAIAQSLALVAAIGAGIAQITALAGGFEKGTEYLTPGQKSNKGKTDTIPAWLAPGERVVPAMINEQLKGIKNADLPKLVAAGKMALEGYGQLNTSITSNSYGFTSEAVGILKRVEAGISEIPRALSDQIVDINFDHYGYVIQQRRVSRHAQKVKALTR